MIRAAVLAGALALVACGGGDKGGAETEAKPEAKPEMAAAPAPATPRVSQGFKERANLGPQPRMTDAERAKLVKVVRAGREKRQTDEIPTELAERPSPRDANPKALFAIYRDGEQVTTLRLGDIPEPTAVADILGKRSKGDIRTVFVRGDTQSRWLLPEELAIVQIRTNKRGLAKLELFGKKAGRKGAGKTKKGSARKELARKLKVKKRDLRIQEIRGVQWIEIRSPDSPRLTGEPG